MQEKNQKSSLAIKGYQSKKNVINIQRVFC